MINMYSEKFPITIKTRTRNFEWDIRNEKDWDVVKVVLETMKNDLKSEQEQEIPVQKPPETEQRSSPPKDNPKEMLRTFNKLSVEERAKKVVEALSKKPLTKRELAEEIFGIKYERGKFCEYLSSLERVISTNRKMFEVVKTIRDKLNLKLVVWGVKGEEECPECETPMVKETVQPKTSDSIASGDLRQLSDMMKRRATNPDGSGTLDFHTLERFTKYIGTETQKFIDKIINDSQFHIRIEKETGFRFSPSTDEDGNPCLDIDGKFGE